MVKARIMKLLLYGLLGLGLGLNLISSAYAVELNGVEMGPSLVDKTIKPGESFEQVFTVQNRTNETVHIEASAQDFRIQDNQWYKDEKPDARWSPMTWATIVSVPEKLDHLEEGKIYVRFDVPENAEKGEHVTYFDTKFIPVAAAQEGTLSAKINVVSEIRSLVYVKVTDAEGKFDLIQTWQLNKATTDFWHFGKPTFTADVTNTGNVHLEVRGNVVIKDEIRNQKTELNIPVFNILPGTEKQMDIAWQEAPFLGYFHGKMQLTYDGKNFEEREFSFVVVPLLTLAGTVLTITVIILAIVLYIRKLQWRLAAAEQRQNNNPGM
jgi:hypothetical protein